ncbi:calpain family cysteine protease [Cooperia oncophora]
MSTHTPRSQFEFTIKYPDSEGKSELTEDDSTQTSGTDKYLEKLRLLNEGAPESSQILFNNLKEAFDNEALIVAAIAARSTSEIEQALDCGLVKGHAYAVTAVKYVELDAEPNVSSSILRNRARIQMIRLQNPWGEREWNGPWSDGSKEWEQVCQQLLEFTVSL